MTTNPDRTAWDNSEPVATDDHHLGSERNDFVQEFRRNFPEVVKDDIVAEEIVEYFEEKWGKPKAMPGMTMNLTVTGAQNVANGQVVKMDGIVVVVDPLKFKIIDMVELILEIVCGCKRCEQRIKAFFWAAGNDRIDDALNHWTPAQGSRIEGKKKFTLYKAAEAFRERMGWPPRPDQRSEESRQKMSDGLKEKYRKAKA